MPKPVCSANSAVDAKKITTIQAEAEGKFTAARPVRDSEILKEKALKAREAEICKAAGGACLRLSHYAEYIANALVPSTGLQVRTELNLARLFASKRVTTKEIAELVKLAQSRDTITDFRSAAQTLFLREGLFYYDYVSHQGAVMCFMPKE